MKTSSATSLDQHSMARCYERGCTERPTTCGHSVADCMRWVDVVTPSGKGRFYKTKGEKALVELDYEHLVEYNANEVMPINHPVTMSEFIALTRQVSQLREMIDALNGRLIAERRANVIEIGKLRRRVEELEKVR